MGALALLLGIVFIVLKLTHVVAWSWLWVTAPIWITLALAVVFMATVGTVLVGLLAGKKTKR